MQPYLFPYIGYFQLIYAVDKFVFYDDVNFIKKGWINRNNILLNNKPHLFSVPLSGVSQNNKINESLIDNSNFDKWRNKFLTTIRSAYKGAAFFDHTFSIIESSLMQTRTISGMAINSVRNVCSYLGIERQFLISSQAYDNQPLGRKERLIDICKREGGCTYINAIGGMELYRKEDFLTAGVELLFLKPGTVRYQQFDGEFVPWLSIIDVLMFNSPEQILHLLTRYELT